MNPAQPAAGTRLCALTDIAEPGSKGFTFRQGEYLFMGFVVRSGGQVIGYIDRCPHTGMPLALFDNFLTREKDLILCASHGALFELEGGKCVAGPCAGRHLWTWPVKLEGDDVVVA